MRSPRDDDRAYDLLVRSFRRCRRNSRTTLPIAPALCSFNRPQPVMFGRYSTDFPGVRHWRETRSAMRRPSDGTPSRNGWRRKTPESAQSQEPTDARYEGGASRAPRVAAARIDVDSVLCSDDITERNNVGSCQRGPRAANPDRGDSG